MTSVSESRGVRRTASGYCRRFSQAVVPACSLGDDTRNRGGQRFTGVGRSPVQVSSYFRWLTLLTTTSEQDGIAPLRQAFLEV